MGRGHDNEPCLGERDGSINVADRPCAGTVRDDDHRQAGFRNGSAGRGLYGDRPHSDLADFGGGRVPDDRRYRGMTVVGYCGLLEPNAVHLLGRDRR